MNFPAELKYTKDHEWIKVEGDIGTVGITEFAQRELGDIVYVELNAVGDIVSENGVFGTIEAVKTVSDLFMPVTGEIVEHNEKLNSSPELVNTDPYGDGWIVKVRLADAAHVAALLTADGYAAIVGA